MKGLHLRDARFNERDAIREVTLAAYQEYAALMPAHWEAYRRHILATLTEVKPAEQIVAEHAGAVVGTVLLYPAGTVLPGPEDVSVTLIWPELRLLAVAPTMRGQGVGAALVQECIRRARQSGATALTLHTTDMMQGAIRLYEQLGFGRAAELDFHVAEGVIIKGYRLHLDETTR